MSSQNHGRIGNGKIDHPPSPVGLRKIKRISNKSFLSLKELVNSHKVTDLITPRGYQKKSKLSIIEPGITELQNTYEYEPTNMANAYDSLYWRWHRVAEWHRYINDPIEKYKGTHNNLI